MFYLVSIIFWYNHFTDIVEKCSTGIAHHQNPKDIYKVEDQNIGDDQKGYDNLALELSDSQVANKQEICAISNKKQFESQCECVC